MQARRQRRFSLLPRVSTRVWQVQVSAPLLELSIQRPRWIEASGRRNASTFANIDSHATGATGRWHVHQRRHSDRQQHQHTPEHCRICACCSPCEFSWASNTQMGCLLLLTCCVWLLCVLAAGKMIVVHHETTPSPHWDALLMCPLHCHLSRRET